MLPALRPTGVAGVVLYPSAMPLPLPLALLPSSVSLPHLTARLFDFRGPCRPPDVLAVAPGAGD